MVVRARLRVVAVFFVTLGSAACQGETLRSVVAMTETFEGEERLMNGDISSAELAALVPIDSIRYEVWECSVRLESVLTLNKQGQARYSGNAHVPVTGAREGEFDPFDFARLVEYLESTRASRLVGREMGFAIHGHCYDVRAWESGRDEPLRWVGDASPGGPQDFWLFRSAFMGMMYRIVWSNTPDARQEAFGGS